MFVACAGLIQRHTKNPDRSHKIESSWLHSSIHKWPGQSFVNTVHRATLYFFNIYINNPPFYLRLDLQNSKFLSGSSTKSLNALFVSPVRVTCSILELIVLLMFGEGYKLWIVLSEFFKPATAFFILHTNRLRSCLYSSYRLVTQFLQNFMIIIPINKYKLGDSLRFMIKIVSCDLFYFEDLWIFTRIFIFLSHYRIPWTWMPNQFLCNTHSS